MSDRQQQTAALSEPGAWLCSTCGNHNFASRSVCHSKTCDARRPFDHPSPQRSPRRPPRHDPTTSKQLVWAEQADKATLEKNQALRKRYLEQPDDMDLEDIERAKILIARDERKKRKKEQRKEKPLTRHPIKGATSETASKSSTQSQHTTFVVMTTEEAKPKRQKLRKDATTTGKSIVNRKIQREVKRRNKDLRIQYMNGGASRMNAQDIERAKALIARDERKRAKTQNRSDT